MRKICGVFVGLGLMLLLASQVQAKPQLSKDGETNECLEGRDFILHAAQSRDQGTSRELFLTKFQDDVLLVQSFPPELRWFVHDEADEQFLLEHTARVFDAPQAPEVHAEAFLNACMPLLELVE